MKSIDVLVGLLLVLLCVVGFFAFPSGQGHSFPSYILAIWFAFSAERLVYFKLAILESKTFLLVVLLFFTLLLATNFSSDPTRLLKAIGVVLLVVVFLLSIAKLADNNHFDTILIILPVLVAVVAASYFLALFVIEGAGSIDEGRLHGYGRMRNPTSMGLVYGYFTVCAFGLATEVVKDKKYVILFVAFFLLLATASTLTGSRGVVAAMCISVGVMFIQTLGWLKNLHHLVGFILVLAFLVSSAGIVSQTLTVSPSFHFGKKELVYASEFDSEKLGVRIGYYDSERRHVDSKNDKLIIHANGRVTAIVFPYFSVEHGYTYYFDVTLESTVDSNDGIYIRFMELDGLVDSPIGYITLNHAVSEPGTIEADREVLSHIDNMGVSVKPKRFVASYRPTSEKVSSLSPLLMKWNGLLNADLIVSNVTVVRRHQSAFDFSLPHFDFDVLGRPTLNSWQTRAAIWTSVWDELASGERQALLGNGILMKNAAITIRNRNGFIEQEAYDHPHSIYMSALRSGGVIGLVLFAIALIRVGKAFSRQEKNLKSTVGAGILVYGMLVLILDGGALVEKVNYSWLLIWIPIGLAVHFEIATSHKMLSPRIIRLLRRLTSNRRKV